MDDIDQRGRIHTTVIDPSPKIRRMLMGIVESHPLLYATEEHATYTEIAHRDRGVEAHQIVLMQETEALKAREILQSNPEVNFVLTGPDLPNSYEEAVKKLKDVSEIVNNGVGNITRFAYQNEEGTNGTNTKLFAEHIEILRKRDRLKRKLDVGIVGMGEFGENILREIIGEPWIGKVVAHSNYFQEADLDKLAFRTVVAQATGGNKVRATRSLDELVKEDPDMILITTGPHKADYSMPRSEFTRRQIVPTWEKIDKVISTLTDKGYDGIIAILSHPPGAFLSKAHKKYGIPAHKLTSFSSDQARAQAEFFNHLMKKLGAQEQAHKYKKELFPIDVYGEHGEMACISWDHIMRAERHPLNPSIEEKDYMNQRVREIGKEIMIAAKTSGFNYFDVPQAVKASLGSLAYYKAATEFAWYTRVGEMAVDAFAKRKNIAQSVKKEYADRFLMLPVELSHPSVGVSIRSDFDPYTVKADLRDQLFKCLVSQSELVAQLT